MMLEISLVWSPVRTQSERFCHVLRGLLMVERLASKLLAKHSFGTKSGEQRWRFISWPLMKLHQRMSKMQFSNQKLTLILVSRRQIG